MKRLTLALVVCLLTLGGSAWGMEKWQGYCQNGGQKVSISGLGQSTTKWMQSYPGCTMTVYDSGTSNLSTIYSDDGVTPKANPFTADSITGLGFFYAANGAYDIKFSGTGISVPFTLSGFLLNDNSGGTINPKIVDTIRFCDQYGGQTDTAIQACLNDTPDGGSAFLSQGTWTMCGALPITITKNVTLTGAGWPSTSGGGTKLSVCGGASGTTDVFHILPGADVVLYGGVISNFAIWPATGVPARYAFHLDGTNGAIANWMFDHIWVEQLGGAAVYAEGPGYNTFHSPQGTPVLTTFQNSYLRGGLTFTNSGDTNRIINNQITGNGNSVDVSFIAGATGFQVRGNNITSDGGMHFGAHVYAPQLTDNEFETFASFTGSNGSVVDFDGAVGDPVQAATVRGGNISIVNGVVKNGVRLNYAVSSTIENVRFSLVTAGDKGILATANSSINFAFNNNFGTWVYTDMFSDAGTGNIFLSPNASTGKGLTFGNNQPLQAFDAAGNAYNMLNMQPGAGGVTLYGYQGKKAIEGGGNVTYAYDGADNIAAAFSTAISTQPVNTTYTTVANFVARNAILPSSAGGIPVGSISLPFSGIYLGNAGTNNILLTGTFTAARTATLPDNTGTLAELNLAQTWSALQTFSSGIKAGASGSTISDSRNLVQAVYNTAGTAILNTHMVIGSCTLGTNCSITLSGAAVFSSGSSYQCSATDETSAAAVQFAPSSGSAFALTGTGTDLLSFTCVGN